MNLLLATLLILASCVAQAQSPARTPSPTPSPTPAAAPASEDQTRVPEVAERSNADSYAVSLGTGELINMNGDQSVETMSLAEYAVSLRARPKQSNLKNLFFYGLSASSVYTNSFAGLGVRDLVSTSVNPYLAALVPTKTGSFMVQYSAVVNPNDTSTGDPQAYHSAGVKAGGSFTRRWAWELAGSGSYGSESARFQGPLTYVVVQTTPVVDTNSAAFLQRTKNVVFSYNSAHLSWLAGRKDVLGWTAFHTYTGIEGASVLSSGTHSNSVGAAMDYAHTVSTRFSWKAYGQAQTLLNGPTCNTYGGGLGAAVKITHAVAFDVAAGPQRNSASCGGQQTANFSATLVTTLKNKDRVYASANRVFRTAYRTDGTWEDNASAGFSKNIGRLNLTTDAGYVRGDTLILGVKPYRGYFVSPRLRIKATETLGFSAGYRTFRGTGGDVVSGNLSFAVVSVEYYPPAIHFR